MGIVVEQQGEGLVVTLEGAIDIACAADLKTAVVAACGSGQEWSVSLAPATYLDITALQLLWAAAHQTRLNGRGLSVSGEVPEFVAHAVADAGFEPFLAAGGVQ